MWEPVAAEESYCLSAPAFASCLTLDALDRLRQASPLLAAVGRLE